VAITNALGGSVRLNFNLLLQGLKFLLERGKFLPGTLQHASLNVKFFPSHQVQLCKTGLKQATKVAFEIILQTFHARRNNVGQAISQIINKLFVHDHSVLLKHYRLLDEPATT